MTYATPADVAKELGRSTPTGTELAQWQVWLDRVERNIVRAFAAAGLTLADEVTDGRVLAADLKDVEVVRVAARITLGLPGGLTSTTVTVDDASVTNRRDGGGPDYDPLALTPADLDALLPDATLGGAFSVPLGGTPGFASWPERDL